MACRWDLAVEKANHTAGRWDLAVEKASQTLGSCYRETVRLELECLIKLISLVNEMEILEINA